MPSLVVVVQRPVQAGDILGHTTSPIERFDLPSRDVRALIPTLRQWKERDIPLFLHPLGPVFLDLLLSLDTRKTFCFRTLDELLDELCLELCARWSVGKGSRCLRAVEEEHVRELWNGDAHGCLRPGLPVVGDCATIDALDVELRKRASHAVEASRQDEYVHFDKTLLGLQACSSHFPRSGSRSHR